MSCSVAGSSWQEHTCPGLQQPSHCSTRETAGAGPRGSHRLAGPGWRSGLRPAQANIRLPPCLAQPQPPGSPKGLPASGRRPRYKGRLHISTTRGSPGSPNGGEFGRERKQRLKPELRALLPASVVPQRVTQRAGRVMMVTGLNPLRAQIEEREAGSVRRLGSNPS